MEAIPRNYKWYRRTWQLVHLKPIDAVRWIRTVFLSSLEKGQGVFPTTISIEVTNNCNMECFTCPQPLISKDDMGYMSIDLFKKIVDECYHFTSLTSFVFTGFGEPFLHPQLVSMSRYVKDKGIPIVRTYTNCLLLKQKTKEILLESGFNEITLSLNAPTQETYERIKESRHYEPVMENIEYFLMKRKAHKIRTPFVNLQLLKLNNVSYGIREFAKNWMPLLKHGDCISIKDSHSFAGQVNDPGVGGMSEPAERVPCGQLWNFLAISWNGDVTPCCADPFKKLKIGNVRDSSLKDLWHSPKITYMRDLHLRREYHYLPLCNKCETWRYFT